MSPIPDPLDHNDLRFQVAEDAWRDVILDDVGSNKKNGVYFVRLTKLRPLTQYKVRLVVLYDSGFNYTEEYTYITNGEYKILGV